MVTEKDPNLKPKPRAGSMLTLRQVSDQVSETYPLSYHSVRNYVLYGGLPYTKTATGSIFCPPSVVQDILEGRFENPSVGLKERQEAVKTERGIIRDEMTRRTSAKT